MYRLAESKLTSGHNNKQLIPVVVTYRMDEEVWSDIICAENLTPIGGGVDEPADRDRLSI